MNLEDSKTKRNLMNAFAGESQARNRYTFAAELARENNLFIIRKIFDITSEQEKEHGEVFYEFLKEFDGMELPVNADYPINTSTSVEDQLREAVKNETAESEKIYREFGSIAAEEGFEIIAGKFYMIADIEKSHAERFNKYYELMKNGKLFVSDVKTGWVCLHCGFALESKEAPKYCPVCGSNQGYFIRMGMVPFL